MGRDTHIYSWLNHGELTNNALVMEWKYLTMWVYFSHEIIKLTEFLCTLFFKEGLLGTLQGTFKARKLFMYLFSFPLDSELTGISLFYNVFPRGTFYCSHNKISIYV